MTSFPLGVLTEFDTFFLIFTVFLIAVDWGKGEDAARERQGGTVTTKHDVEQEVQRLQRTVAEAVAEPETVDLAGITAVLQQATAQVQALRRAAARGQTVTVPADRMHAYFPPQAAAPTAGELHVADARWQATLERGRRYRDEAQAQVGPLLTPAETAQRLGVSPVTVNKWRRQDKLLGLRFDDHQYLYPLFQFTDSPLQGERGVLRHLDGVLQALGSARCGRRRSSCSPRTRV